MMSVASKTEDNADEEIYGEFDDHKKMGPDSRDQ